MKATLKNCNALPVVLLMAIAVLGACAPASYAPRTLDSTPLATHAARSPEDPGLAATVTAIGYRGEWPPAQWTLETLTMAALYFNPRMQTARAQAAVARAGIAGAAQGLPVGLKLAAEHHSRQLDNDSPWSLGVSMDLPVAGSERRAARIDRATALAEAAQLDVAATAWRVRAAVRDALILERETRRRIELLSQRVAAERDMEALVQARVDAGMLSSRELGEAQGAVADAVVALDAERARAQDARSRLANALGLPLDTVERMAIADEMLDAHAPLPSPGEARDAALKNRLDVQRLLLEFGAADAQVRLAVAEQYPTLSLSPGYLWDQGDHIWSLAAGVLIPPGLRNPAGVREAEASRELAARRFEALQLEVIGDVEQALGALDAVAARQQSAAHRAGLARQQFARMQRLFDAGASGRFDLAVARLAQLSALGAVQDAESARLRATARLEDAVEKPLLAPYLRLPEQSEPQRSAP